MIVRPATAIREKWLTKGVQLALSLFQLLCLAEASAAPIHWSEASGGNGHYYEFIGDTTSWHNARDIAASSSHLGRQGYLVTITSAAEHAFIRANVTQAFAYAGGSDAETEGVWRWVTGPEAGEIFWQLGVGTVTYADWYVGEPNNGGGIEDYLMVNYLVENWNDERGVGPYGFIIEYGGLESTEVPEPTGMAVWVTIVAVAAICHGRQRCRALFGT